MVFQSSGPFSQSDPKNSTHTLKRTLARGTARSHARYACKVIPMQYLHTRSAAKHHPWCERLEPQWWLNLLSLISSAFLFFRSGKYWRTCLQLEWLHLLY